MNDEELPEWFQMLKEVFKEWDAFDMRIYEDMNCANVLNQVRFAAIRDKKHSDAEEQSERAAELHVHPTTEQTCPECDGAKLVRFIGGFGVCPVCKGTGKSNRSAVE